MHKKILVLDDDERLVYLISEILKKHEFEVIGTTQPSRARNLITTQQFDAMVVDWMMPHESGIDFIKSIRSSSDMSNNIPAIMLTALDSIDNKIEGFESGYDDYLTKPFEEMELVLRLRAIIKRSQKPSKTGKTISFGDCIFDLQTERLTQNGETIPLSSTEISLLKTFCQRPNQAISRVDLAKKISFQVSDRTIDVQINRLRKKIGDNSKTPEIIRTVRYVGYMLVC